MAMIASIVMNLQVNNEAEACDAVNEILREEQITYKAGSPLVDYAFETPAQSPYGYFETAVQLYLNVRTWSEAGTALSEILDDQVREQVLSSCLIEWHETCLEQAPPYFPDPYHPDYSEGDAFATINWGQIIRFDKNRLSDLLGVVDSAIEGINAGVLTLKPHELKAEGYTQEDVESTRNRLDMANDLRSMLLVKMAACEGELAESTNLPRRAAVDVDRLADRYHTTELPDHKISVANGDFDLVAIDLSDLPNGGRMIYWSVEKPEFGVDRTVLFAESFADYRRKSIPEIRESAITIATRRLGDAKLAKKCVDEVIRAGGMLL